MKNETGLTIIETVVLVLVVAIALVPLIAVFGNVLHDSAARHSIHSASFLAEGLMEEVTGRDFADIESFMLGKGELSPAYPDFTAEVSVDYVRREDFNTPAGEPTDFKRITVSVIWRNGKTSLATLRAAVR